MIARCLVHHDYSPVHIPTQKDEQVKEFIRLRDGHCLALTQIVTQVCAKARGRNAQSAAKSRTFR